MLPVHSAMDVPLRLLHVLGTDKDVNADNCAFRKPEERSFT